MEFHTVHEFRKKVSDMLNAKIPADLQREVFTAATDALSRQRVALGISEEQIESDIEELHRKRRAAGGGR